MKNAFWLPIIGISSQKKSKGMQLGALLASMLRPHIIRISLSEGAKIDCPKEYLKLHPHIIGNLLADTTDRIGVLAYILT